MANDRNLYGCDIREFAASVCESLTFAHSGLDMCILSILSDAQEELMMERNEDARKTINRAKYLISERRGKLNELLETLSNLKVEELADEPQDIRKAAYLARVITGKQARALDLALDLVKS